VYKVLTGKVLEIPDDEVLPSSSSSLSSYHQMMDTEINSLLEVDIGGNQPVIKVTKYSYVFSLKSNPPPSFTV